MRALRAFGRFWYHLVVGDDWTIAAGVLAGLLAAYALTRARIEAWWLLPAVALGLLAQSLWRARRSG